MADLKNESRPDDIFLRTKQIIEEKGFVVSDHDFNRPWGGFFVIQEEQSQKFISEFFPNINPQDFSAYAKLSPKILLVAPGKRLSWQYHRRRAEIWKVISGEAGVVRSKSDQQGELETYGEGKIIELEKGERHRLVGLDDWATIAEIWKHTDPANPSDEDDIIRLSDDFGR